MDDYSRFTKVIDYPVSDIQGGRGEVNPPMAYEKQPRHPGPRRGGTRREIEAALKQGPVPITQSREAFSAAPLEGAADMITAQSFDYLPAAIAYGVGKSRGDNYSFKEVLNAARKRTQEVRAGNPVGYGVGQVAGLVYGGARMLPAAVEGITPAVTAALPRVFGSTAAKLAPWIATPAVLGTEGAISGLAKSEGDLSAAAKGAGIGVGAGLLPIAAAAKPITTGLSDMFLKGVSKKATEASKNKRSRETDAELTTDDLMKFYADTKGSLGKNSLKRMWDFSVKEISSAVAPAAIGALGGAGAAALAGKDTAEGAYYGAAGTVAATKIKILDEASDAAKMTLGRFVIDKQDRTAKVIKQFGTTVSKGITDIGTTVSNKKKEVAEDDYSRFTKVQ